MKMALVAHWFTTDFNTGKLREAEGRFDKP
jgi:hypothetical protein